LKAGVTYKFLLKGVPDGKGNTDYTAWFCTEENAWNVIASFKRPQTNTYLKRFHSFLRTLVLIKATWVERLNLAINGSMMDNGKLYRRLLSVSIIPIVQINALMQSAALPKTDTSLEMVVSLMTLLSLK
jgi:hypothetical protein